MVSVARVARAVTVPPRMIPTLVYFELNTTLIYIKTFFSGFYVFYSWYILNTSPVAYCGFYPGNIWSFRALQVLSYLPQFSGLNFTLLPAEFSLHQFSAF